MKFDMDRFEAEVALLIEQAYLALGPLQSCGYQGTAEGLHNAMMRVSLHSRKPNPAGPYHVESLLEAV